MPCTSCWGKWAWWWRRCVGRGAGRTETLTPPWSKKLRFVRSEGKWVILAKLNSSSLSDDLHFYCALPPPLFSPGSYSPEFCAAKKCSVQVWGAVDVGSQRLPQPLPGGSSFGRHIGADHRHRPHFTQQIPLVWTCGDHLLRKRRCRRREYRR